LFAAEEIAGLSEISTKQKRAFPFKCPRREKSQRIRSDING